MTQVEAPVAKRSSSELSCKLFLEDERHHTVVTEVVKRLRSAQHEFDKFTNKNWSDDPEGKARRPETRIQLITNIVAFEEVLKKGSVTESSLASAMSSHYAWNLKREVLQTAINNILDIVGQ